MQQGVAVAPARIIHRAGEAPARLAGRGRRAWLVAYAAQKRAARVFGQHCGDIGIVERGVRDDGARQAVGRMHALEPARLGDGRGPVPLRLDMHRPDDAVAAGVAAIIRRQVVAPQRCIIAVAEGDWLAVASHG